MASLYVFASVAGLLECGSVPVESDSAARRIIKICEAEQQRCLKRYDKEIAKIEGDKSHA